MPLNQSRIERLKSFFRLPKTLLSRLYNAYQYFGLSGVSPYNKECRAIRVQVFLLELPTELISNQILPYSLAIRSTPYFSCSQVDTTPQDFPQLSILICDAYLGLSVPLLFFQQHRIASLQVHILYRPKNTLIDIYPAKRSVLICFPFSLKNPDKSFEESQTPEIRLKS